MCLLYFSTNNYHMVIFETQCCPRDVESGWGHRIFISETVSKQGFIATLSSAKSFLSSHVPVPVIIRMDCFLFQAFSFLCCLALGEFLNSLDPPFLHL